MHAAITWAVAAATMAAIVLRPLRVAEWVWAVIGACVLVATGVLSGNQAAAAARDGLNVYAFLFGMLALAELARVHGIFEWLTTHMLHRARGNTARLFAWMFVAAIAVTALLSNDGTILLLTPMALALARQANVPVLPFAFAAAFVANAASFILPISNPANLVVFSPLPPLQPWLAAFAAASATALACTYLVLRVFWAAQLRQAYAGSSTGAHLAPHARLTIVVVSAALAVLVAAAALAWPVGYVACGLGIAAVLVVGIRDRASVPAVARAARWSIIPLVAGLFVIVRALDETGALQFARSVLQHASAMTPLFGRLYAGASVTIADAAINNLPAGLIARYALQGQGIAPHIARAVLVGIDLGPNLSISASLATLLWVMILRRDGVQVRPLQFLAAGALVTIPSLVLALLVLS